MRPLVDSAERRERISQIGLKIRKDAFPAPRDADLLLVPPRPAEIELIEGAPTGGADSDSRDLQRPPDPPPALRPPQLVVLEPQLLEGLAAVPSLSTSLMSSGRSKDWSQDSTVSMSPHSAASTTYCSKPILRVGLAALLAPGPSRPKFIGSACQDSSSVEISRNDVERPSTPLSCASMAYARRRDSACQNGFSRPPRTHSGSARGATAKLSDSL